MLPSQSLREEGIARELVNRIQNLRKDSGFEVTDNIDVILLHHEHMHKAIQNNLDYIKLETLTDTLQEVNQLDEGIEINFDNISTKLFIQNTIKNADYGKPTDIQIKSLRNSKH